MGSHHHQRKYIAEDKVGNGITNTIQQVIGVMSGKGGVGKSTVTGLLALELKRAGYAVGILDADLTGPSIPRLFGVNQVPEKIELGVLPAKSRENIGIMSVDLLLEDKEAPVLWRGPILTQVIRQFWEEVIWADLDFLLIDMPPGTGDIPLTVLQSIPLDGAILVTGPQDVTNAIVRKTVTMLDKLSVPALGVIENMGYLPCGSCNTVLYPFGESHAKEMADACGLPVLANLAIDPELVELANKGRLGEYTGANSKLLAPVRELLGKKVTKI